MRDTNFCFGLRFVAAITLLAITACASSTTIQSVPQGARLYLNGEPVGATPYVMTDTKIVGSSTMVRLELPGYETVNGVISRNEEFDAGACIGGVFLLFPFLWIQGYKPFHTFELHPLGTGYAPPPGYAPFPGYGQPREVPPPHTRLRLLGHTLRRSHLLVRPRHPRRPSSDRGATVGPTHHRRGVHPGYIDHRGITRTFHPLGSGIPRHWLRGPVPRTGSGEPRGALCDVVRQWVWHGHGSDRSLSEPFDAQPVFAVPHVPVGFPTVRKACT